MVSQWPDSQHGIPGHLRAANSFEHQQMNLTHEYIEAGKVFTVSVLSEETPCPSLAISVSNRVSGRQTGNGQQNWFHGQLIVLICGELPE
jgi:hypothetical protein